MNSFQQKMMQSHSIASVQNMRASASMRASMRASASVRASASALAESRARIMQARAVASARHMAAMSARAQMNARAQMSVTNRVVSAAPAKAPVTTAVQKPMISKTTEIKLQENGVNVIPKNIFQTWTSRELPSMMTAAIMRIKKKNPDFKHYFYDDASCREFIKANYHPDVLTAFDSLVPGAYKADLWRYCVLYKMGGIYIDVRYTTVGDFDLNQLITLGEQYVLDVGMNGIYNAVMIAPANSPFLKKAIMQVVRNVRTKYYGTCALCPTGPAMLWDLYTESKLPSAFKLKHKLLGDGDFNKCIILNNKIIFRGYPGYEKERLQNGKPHYTPLWNERKIYA